MSDPYLGEIRLFAGDFAPANWALCDGQLLQIRDYQALFSLLGSAYGGDGLRTFALPDLRGRVPMHRGPAFGRGQSGGSEIVVLSQAELPAHAPTMLASIDVAKSNDPGGGVLAAAVGAEPYGTDAPTTSLAPAAISSLGGGGAHANMQPFMCVSFIISLSGIFPPHTPPAGLQDDEESHHGLIHR